MDRTGFFLMKGSKLSFEIRLFKQCYSAGLLFHKEASINYVTRVGGGECSGNRRESFQKCKRCKTQKEIQKSPMHKVLYLFYPLYFQGATKHRSPKRSNKLCSSSGGMEGPMYLSWYSVMTIEGCSSPSSVSLRL